MVKNEEGAAHKRDSVPSMLSFQNGGHISPQKDFLRSALDENEKDQRKDERFKLIETENHRVGHPRQESKETVCYEAESKPSFPKSPVFGTYCLQ